MFDLTNARFINSKVYPLSFLFLIIFIGIDVTIDLKEGVPLKHLIHELTIVCVCLFVLVLQFLSLKRQNLLLSKSKQKLAESEKERLEFQKKIQTLSQSFSQIAQEEFERWNLSSGEQDVAILLIKGMSMKEIAETRKTNEATVRQQAANVYRKSGQEGRSRLAAYFLEDLFQ